MTVQVMEKIGYGYVFAAGNLGLAFPDSRQFGLGRLIRGRIYGRNGDRARGHLEFEAVTALNAGLALYTRRHEEAAFFLHSDLHDTERTNGSHRKDTTLLRYNNGFHGDFGYQ